MLRLLLPVFSALLLAGCSLNEERASSESPSPEIAWSIPFSDNYVTAVQPLLDNDRVYLTLGPTVRCYRLNSGDLCWQARMLSRDRDIGSREIFDSPNRIFVHSGARVHSYTKADGDLVWETVIPDFDLPAFARAADTDTHLFFGGNGEIVRLRKSDGGIDLRIPVDTLQPEGVVQTARNVRVVDGMLYAPTVYFRESFGVVEGNILAYDADTGTLKWAKRLRNPEIPSNGSDESIRLDSGAYALAADANKVVVPAGQVVYAFDPKSGEQLWDRFFPNDGFSTSVTMHDRTAYVGANSSMLYAIDATNGDLQWSTETSGTLTTILTVSDNRIYFCNELGGDLWVLDQETGDVIIRAVPSDYSQQSRSDTCVSPLGVGATHLVNIGGRKIYALTKLGSDHS